MKTKYQEIPAQRPGRRSVLMGALGDPSSEAGKRKCIEGVHWQIPARGREGESVLIYQITIIK